jgi:hypothetical protein
LGTFWLKIEQFWPFEEICIFRTVLTNTILKGTIPARFGLIWFSGFRGEDLGMKLKKIFSSETTEPISTKLC